MISLTNRYTVEDLVPVVDGWQIGFGQDIRLDRQVLVCVIAASQVSDVPFQEWLAARAAVSHPHIAALLDCERTDEEYICVFETGREKRLGLPDLERARLLQSLLQLVDGVQFLSERVTVAPFSATQIVWVAGKPKVLGLMRMYDVSDHTEQDLSEELRSYCLTALEWHAVTHQDDFTEASPAWQAGMERCTAGTLSLRELHRTLEALHAAAAAHVAEGRTPPIPIGTSPMSDLDKTVPIPLIHAQSMRTPLEEEAVIVPASRRRAKIWIPVTLIGGMAIVLLIGIMLTRTSPTGTEGSGQSASPAAPAVAANASSPSTSAAAAGSTSLASLINLPVAQVVHDLQQKGIRSRDIAVVASQSGESHSAGTVLHVTPASAQGNVTLTVFVPSGSALVPNLIGQTVASASDLSLHAGLHFSYVMKNEPNDPVGTVYLQSPAPFSIVPVGTKLTFTVANRY